MSKIAEAYASAIIIFVLYFSFTGGNKACGQDLI